MEILHSCTLAQLIYHIKTPVAPVALESFSNAPHSLLRLAVTVLSTNLRNGGSPSTHGYPTGCAFPDAQNSPAGQ